MLARASLRIDLSNHVDCLGEVGVEMPPHDVEHFHLHRIPQRIVYLVPRLAVHYQLPATQNRQVRLLDS